ncbi:hypothetical protein KC19_1G268400 [Ceratodon purpureus]|uniref:Uncharacterized protein n=1 Tax=Ceratodon purpureus TaxID=3225 RepID=A0A8T0JCR8_CERPU|nr:hypothetical protein KC19_1G268400 [Ceratodon purpureus]
MDNWSPNTMVRYGFAQVDEGGNVVSIWNFPDLEEVFKEVEIQEGSVAEGKTDGDVSPPLASAVREALQLEVGEEIEGVMSRTCNGPCLEIRRPSIPPEVMSSGEDVEPDSVFYDDLPQLESEDVTCQDNSTWAEHRNHVPAHDLDMPVIHIQVGRIALVLLAASCRLTSTSEAQLPEWERDLVIHMLTHSMDGLLRS